MGPTMTARPWQLFDDEDLESFRRQGYVIKQGWLDEDEVATVSADVERYAATEPAFDGRNVWKYPDLCGLITDRATLAAVEQLLRGAAFTLHHCHAASHRPGLRGVNWHHDYEQVPQTNRSHTQVHVLHYLGGLNGTIGDLLLLPGSHRAVMRRDAMWGFGTEDLPGSVTVDELAPGSVVFAHSALVHARRPRDGGDGQARYFIDIAFVERGITWPSYGRDGWQDMLGELDARYAVPGRPELFDASAFFDIADAVARVQGVEGSLAMALPPVEGGARPVAGAIPVVQ